MTLRFTKAGPEAMSGRVVRIAGAELAGREDLMDALSVALGLPDWFGRNWDALRDVLGDPGLRNDVSTVVVADATRLWREHPRMAGALTEVWQDADVHLVFEW